eukprot:52455-Pleurochrysis_carterae.AAC.1
MRTQPQTLAHGARRSVSGWRRAAHVARRCAACNATSAREYVHACEWACVGACAHARVRGRMRACARACSACRACSPRRRACRASRHLA